MQPPFCTYRIQLHEHFGFDDLAGLLDYLHELGVSTVYAAPVTTAVRGSQHGYDVTNPLRINPEIGTEEQLARLAAKLQQYGMSWLQDIVPNHMAYSTQNPWLYDVLERGKDSAWYSFFDIGGAPAGKEPAEPPGGRLMAPFLGKPLGDCLEQRELSLQFTGHGFVIRYFDTDYPVAALLYPRICNVAGDCPRKLTAILDKLMKAVKAPPPEWAAAKKEALHEVITDPALAWYIGERVRHIQEQRPLLEEILKSQHYLLTDHREASTVINYRRFFTVNSLICLRMEDPAVFDTWHRMIHRWYTQGWIQGLRIDHIDGLAEPKIYLDRLRRLFGEDCYLIAEKILARDETLPPDWPLQGTTGYEFLGMAGQLLTDASGSRQLLEFYRQEVIDLPPYEELVYQRKYDFLRRYMNGELDNLLSPGDPVQLKETLAVLMASFPVYRVYPGEGPLSAAESEVLQSALAAARRRYPACGPQLDLLQQRLETDKVFFTRLSQFTGPLAAKGIEDTSFYIYNPYIAHNEVGDSPAIAGISAADFHRHMADRQAALPLSLNCTTTHDTKRGEDSRIRLNLLSAQPQEWITAVREWRALNSPLIARIGGRRAPSANDEYLIYQALLGSFPAEGAVTDEFRKRFSDYLAKALREAKTETDYDDPDEWYEQQCQTFAATLLAPGSAFLEKFMPFAAGVIRESYGYSLSQLLLKLTAPGIPDIYQGAELWELSLVDPDNRRPVDFILRRDLLWQIKAAEAGGKAATLDFVLSHPERGTMKLYTLYRTLQYRRQHPDVFTQGEYIPVEAEGPLLAYVRRRDRDWVLVLVPLIGGQDGETPDDRADGDTASPILRLPPGAPAHWTHLFTGDVYHAAGGGLEWGGWERFPVAVLVGS